MQEIICDTNVWYDLSGNCESRDATLIPTFCNIFELIHTLKSETNFKAAKKAIDNLYKGGFLPNTYVPNPYAHIIGLESGKFPFLQSEAIIKDIFFEFAKGKITKEELGIKTKPLLKDRELSNIANMLNETLTVANVTFQNNKESAIKWTKVYISCRVKEWAKTLGKKYYMERSFDWSQIELFLNTKALFIRKVVFNKMRYSHKDMFDLWNMVYVKPGNLYWTWEGVDRRTNEVSHRLRWHNLIREAEMEHYLFLPKKVSC